MAMKKCKDCGEEISKSAKTCPKCGKEQRNFLKRHKILSVIAGLIILIIGITSLNTDLNNTSKNNNTAQTSSQSSSLITKENYNKITNGMTKEEVFAILGEKASISESNMPGVGTMELYHFQETFSTTAIDVTFLDGKVYSKNWTQL